MAPLPAAFCRQLALLSDGLGIDERLFDWQRAQAGQVAGAAPLAVGVERGRATPRAIRHGFADHFLRGGAALNIVQEALGHRFISSTSVYLG